MNIDDLKLGQIKEIQSLLGNQSQTKHIGSSMVGKYVIVRSRNEGINAGYVLEMDGTGIVLEDAKRIWYHKPKDESLSWYEGVALSGLSEDSKVSAPVKKAIIEDYSVTVCSDIARQSIIEKVPHAQN